MMAGYVQLVSGQIKCSLPKTPQIMVTTTSTPVRYDYTKSQRQLETMGNDTVSPYGARVKTHVGGLMKGEVTVSQNMRFYQETYPNVRAGCLYIDSIKVDLHMKPVIYVAREHKKSSCMHQSILEHEKKHVMVDQTLISKYRDIITAALQSALPDIRNAKGPFSSSALPSEQKKLQTHVQGIVKKYSAQLTEERKKRQQDVDTLEEYERVQAQCGGRA
jgi:hypothetical protein